MSSELSEEQMKNFEGFLEKKSKHLMSIWQRRYFRILDGKVMVYTIKKDDSEIKGQFNLELITMPESVDARVFKFTFDQRIFALRAASEEEKNNWINVITTLKNGLVQQRALRDSMKLKPGHPLMPKEKEKEKEKEKDASTLKKNKIESAGKVTADIIKKHGFVTNKEEKYSNELLKAKGITDLINVTDPKISTRIYHGFIFKKHKTRDYFQKRWFFIFSSRPLLDANYAEDDYDLEPKKQKDWLKFDTLYYFKYEDDESSQSLGSLELVNCHKVELLDKEDKFYLYLDVEDRKFDYYCESKSERDKWFEVIKNSRRTAKEYKLSVTKHPRNIELLYTRFLMGEKEFIKQLEKEKKAIAGSGENEDYEVFEFTINSLADSMIATLDGCNSNTPPVDDLAKAYAINMGKEYLDIIKSFWDKKYSELTINDTLKISMTLFQFAEKLYTIVNVEDQNYYRNAKALVKIYLKKTYNNVLSVIENILKDEREIKALKNETGIYYTKGPYDLFELLSGTFDLVKNNKHKYLYQVVLNLFSSCVTQYLLGVETVLNNRDIVIDREYALAVANNSLYLIDLFNKFLDVVKDMKVLNEEEINEYMKTEKLMETINKIALKSITAFVFCFVNELGEYFKDTTFSTLNMTKILISTNDLFGPYKQYMNSLVLKKAWNEILKLTLYHYIRLLLTSRLSSSTVDQIREKLKEDAGILKETYEGLVGKNLTESTVRILGDISTFLESSLLMISSSCLTLRQYVGPSFDINVAKTLIKLRTDFNSSDKDEAIKTCKDVLDNCKDDDNTNKENYNITNYFQIIEKELKRQEEEEIRLKRRQTLTEAGIDPAEIPNVKEEDITDIEEDEKPDETTIFALDNFLNEEDEDKEESFKFYEEDKEVAQEEVSDIVYEGTMQKKTHSKWQSRYFQIKSGYLYWFKDKKKSIVQNKISIRNTIKIVSHKEKKFMMVVNKSMCVNDSNASISNASIAEENEDIKDGKVYKFACENNEERDKWVKALTSEMVRLKKIEDKKKLEIPVRKNVVKDYFDLPGFNHDIYYMRKKVLEEMSKEDFFKPSEKKLKALERKRLREEKARQQKIKEEEEKKIQEENKKIEEDIKNGKDVGISNKLKFWFRTNVASVEEKIKSNINNINEYFGGQNQNE